MYYLISNLGQNCSVSRSVSSDLTKALHDRPRGKPASVCGSVPSWQDMQVLTNTKKSLEKRSGEGCQGRARVLLSREPVSRRSDSSPPSLFPSFQMALFMLLSPPGSQIWFSKEITTFQGKNWMDAFTSHSQRRVERTHPLNKIEATCLLLLLKAVSPCDFEDNFIRICFMFWKLTFQLFETPNISCNAPTPSTIPNLYQQLLLWLSYE